MSDLIFGDDMYDSKVYIRGLRHGVRHSNLYIGDQIVQIDGNHVIDNRDAKLFSGQVILTVKFDKYSISWSIC